MVYQQTIAVTTKGHGAEFPLEAGNEAAHTLCPSGNAGVSGSLMGRAAFSRD